MTSRNQAPLRAPVVALTGAGVSTDSGIPDFRSKGGLWDRYDPMAFAIDRFHADPARFWHLRAEMITAAHYLDARPNAAHHVLARAVREGRVDTLVTQNVDGLHAKAGTPRDRLIEVHGDGAHCVCLSCARRQPTTGVLAALAADGAGSVPTCACGGLLKPAVVLFGEPVLELDRAAAAVSRCRTLVVAGSSLKVYPVAGLVDLALAGDADLVLCDREATAYDGAATRLMRGPVAKSLAALFGAGGEGGDQEARGRRQEEKSGLDLKRSVQ